MTPVHHHHHADPWLLIACVLGFLTLFAAWHWFMAAINSGVGRIFAGIVR